MVNNLFYLNMAVRKYITLFLPIKNRIRELIQQRQNALEHQALHDTLTDLPNRVHRAF